MRHPFSCILVQPRLMSYRTRQMQASLQIFLKNLVLIQEMSKLEIDAYSPAVGAVLDQSEYFWTRPKMIFQTIILLLTNAMSKKSWMDSTKYTSFLDISGWKEPQIFSGRFEYWFRLQALREAADIKGVEPPKIGSLGLTKQILNSEGISGRGCQLDHNGSKVIYAKYFKQWFILWNYWL